MRNPPFISHHGTQRPKFAVLLQAPVSMRAWNCPCATRSKSFKGLQSGSQTCESAIKRVASSYES